MKQQFADYVREGWYLCAIPSGGKRPILAGWNTKENAITDPGVAEELTGVGLCHAWSGTCALDIDDFAATTEYLAAKGIGLWSLLLSGVQIDSGRPNRAKLIYRLPTPIVSKKIKNADGSVMFELRCIASTGNSDQDVLPPTAHPAGGEYKWVGDWRNLPPIPEALLQLWKAETHTVSEQVHKVSKTDTLREPRRDVVKALLAKQSPDMGYEDWYQMGGRIHHEFGGSDEGFRLWDDWSANSSKYPGTAVLRSKWSSFGRTENPATIDGLLRYDVAGSEEFQDHSAVPGEPTLDEILGVKPKPKVKYQWLNDEEFCDRPTPDWMIENVLPFSGIGAIYGPSGGGKTFLAVDAAFAIATEGVWQGRLVTGGQVLYIAAEDNYGVQIRVNVAKAVRGLRTVPIRFLATTPNLMDESCRTALLASIKEQGNSSVVIVDTFAAVLPGADENAGKDMGEILYFCQAVHEQTGAMVLLIHHTGKDVSKGPRGWSGLHGAFDFEWEVTEREHYRRMRIAKMKNAPNGKIYPFQIRRADTSCWVEWFQPSSTILEAEKEKKK